MRTRYQCYLYFEINFSILHVTLKPRVEYPFMVISQQVSRNYNHFLLSHIIGIHTKLCASQIDLVASTSLVIHSFRQYFQHRNRINANRKAQYGNKFFKLAQMLFLQFGFNGPLFVMTFTISFCLPCWEVGTSVDASNPHSHSAHMPWAVLVWWRGLIEGFVCLYRGFCVFVCCSYMQ